MFISSAMSGEFGFLREAAARGIEALGYEPARAEDYGASPGSPQAACLEGVRSSAAVVLVLGSEYGSRQASGLSATHEEYREARDESVPVLAFVEEGADPSAEQAGFVAEVQDWLSGLYTESFAGAGDLQQKVTQSLHRLSLAEAAAPLDEGELAGRARSLLPDRSPTGRATLAVAVAGSPPRQVVRPADLGGDDLLRLVLGEARDGDTPVLSLTAGTSPSIGGETLTIAQHDTGSYVSLSETGSVVVAQPATDDSRPPTAIPAITEEEVAARIAGALRFAGRMLDLVDPQQRITHVAAAAAMLGGSYLPWRSRAEQAQDPHSATASVYGQDPATAELSPPTRRRAALARDADQLAEDLAVRLRRSATDNPYQ